MAERVTTPALRFAFVEKLIADCGDYTDFPLEVTGATISDKLDKIAEIFYRVRLAQFTENTLDTSSYAIIAGLTTGAISPRVMWSDGMGHSNNYLMSGYYTIDETPSEVYAAALPFLGSQYTQYYWDAVEASGTFRDINSREPGMWLPNGDGSETPKWNKPDYSFINGGLTQTAFTWYSNSAAGSLTQPSIPIPWITQFDGFDDIYETLEISVKFTGRIGVVYGGAVGNILHASNRFFIEMLISGGITGASGFFTSAAIESGYSATSTTYTMRLSSGDLSCPLNSNDSGLSGNFTHEATEWWPSAKNSPSTAVWNTATGVKL